MSDERYRDGPTMSYEAIGRERGAAKKSYAEKLHHVGSMLDNAPAYRRAMTAKARKSWTLRFIIIQCLFIVITYIIIIYWKPDNIAGRIGIASILTFVWGGLSTVIIYTNNSNSNLAVALEKELYHYRKSPSTNRVV